MKLDTVLILGARSDIAQAIAYDYAPVSKHIILAARNADTLGPLSSDITIRHGAKVTLLDFDASQPATHAAFMSNLPGDVDTVICVFGYLGENEKALADFDEAERIITTNYTGAVSILNKCAIVFEKQKKGTIIGISSVAGERGRQSNFIYGSAKAAFSVYLDGLRNRMFPHGVHVMTVKPGFVDTRMTAGMPLPKPLTAQPAQVAKAVLKGHQSKTNTLYVLWMWRYIMLIIKSIPEFMFKKMKM